MEKVITRIAEASWERIYLFLKIRSDSWTDEETHIYLVNKKNLVEAEFEIISREADTVLVKLNVTNTGINRCVVNGTYRVITVIGEDKYSVAGYEGATETLASWGRHFMYLSNKGVYTITFLMDEFSEEPTVHILVFNAVTKNIGNIPKLAQKDVPAAGQEADAQETVAEAEQAALQHAPESTPWYKKTFVFKFLKKIKKKFFSKAKKQKAARLTYRYANAFYRRFWPGKKKRILFFSEQDDRLALNMEVLYQRMLERGMDQEFVIEKSLRKRTSEKQTAMSEVKNLLKLATSDVIIMDDHAPTFDKIKLHPSAKVIQIWHAGAGYKGVGYSRWGHLGCPGPYSCHRQYTYCISGSANISGFFSEQFGILDEQIIPTGMPRFDLFCNAENRKKVTESLYEMYPQFRGKYVVLFAPTYRGRDKKTAYYPYDRIDFAALADYCKEKNAVILFKMHPWVAEPVPIAEEYQDIMFNLNEYGNINDLFYITDLLITDYSSCIYEFSLMKKPMLFFAYDKTQYSTSRGFHRNYDETIPGKLCEDFESLITAMRNEDFQYEKVEEYLADHFDQVDDKNSDRVIDWLVLDGLPEQYRTALEEKNAKVAASRGKNLSYLFEGQA